MGGSTVATVCTLLGTLYRSYLVEYVPFRGDVPLQVLEQGAIFVIECNGDPLVGTDVGCACHLDNTYQPYKHIG